MTGTTYVICTAAGAKMLAFDSLAKAKAELALRQRRYTRPLHIVEQRIVERKIA